MKLLLAGASGMIGTALTAAAHEAGHEVKSLVRRAPDSADEFGWDPAARRIDAAALDWAESVVCLSGASVAHVPWTATYRRLILESRVDCTETLAQGILDAQNPPLAWVNASASGFYGSRPGELLTEVSAGGEGFLADVCARWEAATEQAADRLRVAKARTGIVLGRGGAMRPIVMSTRFGLGTRMGSGTQFWPWISLRDEVAALLHLATASSLHGPVNLVGPAPATSEEITRAVARALRRPHLFVAPEAVLRFGLGDMAEDMLLSDQRIEPAALVADGFSFSDATHTDAVRYALSAKA